MERPRSAPRLHRTGDVGRAEGLRLQRAHGRGALVRVRHGVYVAAEDWATLDARERHVLRVHAILPELPPRVMISHLSAAAVLGWPHLGRWPERVHVTDPDAPRSRSRSGVVIHHGPEPRDPPSRLLHGIPVASAAETGVTLARALPFPEAVVVLDHLLRTRAVTHGELVARLPRRPEPGSVRAARAVEFADGRRESVGESYVAVRLEEVGAPRPEPQHEFRHPDGTVDRVDFWFPEQGLVLEFDGRQKYTDPEMLRGRRPEDVLWTEKRREDRIRRRDEVTGFGRTIWYELADADRFRGALRDVGIPFRIGPMAARASRAAADRRGR